MVTSPTSATDSLRIGIAQPVGGICAPESAIGSRAATNTGNMETTGAPQRRIGWLRFRTGRMLRATASRRRATGTQLSAGMARDRAKAQMSLARIVS